MTDRSTLPLAAELLLSVDKLAREVLGLEVAELGDDLFDAVLLWDDVLRTTGVLAPANL